jgi:hypothetical protein
MGLRPGDRPRHDADGCRRKIDEAHEVLVLNVGGYVGDSTRREIAYAEGTGQPVRYLEPPRGGQTP